MSTVWQPHLGLDPDLVPIIRKAIDAMPAAHLIEPKTGETFDSHEAAWDRVQNWAFTQGFAMVTGPCHTGSKYYECIHRGKETANKRKLDQHASKDGSTNRTQELTHIKAKDCKWRLVLQWKELSWRLKVPPSRIEHSHLLVPDPLTYTVHKQRQPDYHRACEQARVHRESGLPYRTSDRLLDNTPKDDDVLLHIDRRKYYNLIPSVTRSREDIIVGLLAALDNDNFICRCRYSYVRDVNHVVVKRKLEQIFLMDNYQKTLAKRFVSYTLMELDATFNTNALKMLLFVAVGVTNCNKTFPAAFSYAISESEVAFNWFFTCLNEEVFDDCPPPSVCLGDQAKGLMAALPTSLPGCIRQLCAWHAAENIAAAVLKSKGHSKDERDEIHDATWAWIKSSTVAEMEENRGELLALLNEEEKRYMQKNWFSKGQLICFLIVVLSYRRRRCCSFELLLLGFSADKPSLVLRSSVPPNFALGLLQLLDSPENRLIS